MTTAQQCDASSTSFPQGGFKDRGQQETALAGRLLSQKSSGSGRATGGPYGERIARLFHLDSAQSLTTTALSTAQIAATRLASSPRGVGVTAPIPVEKAYIVSLQLRDLLGNQLWKEGRLVAKGPFAAGSIGIVHLEDEPISHLPEAFDCLQFYIPEIVFDELADDRGAPRISRLTFQSAAPDPVIHQLGRALLPELENPSQASHLFFDHIAFAAYSHLATRYGALLERPTPTAGRLSASQERMAKELLTADLAEEPSLAAVARACGLPVGRFIRAFRQTTGAPPYRWLRSARVERAKVLLFESALSLAQIAYECGFADQSHFTRVFSHSIGTTPGAWRRARRDRNHLHEPVRSVAA